MVSGVAGPEKVSRSENAPRNFEAVRPSGCRELNALPRYARLGEKACSYCPGGPLPWVASLVRRFSLSVMRRTGDDPFCINAARRTLVLDFSTLGPKQTDGRGFYNEGGGVLSKTHVCPCLRTLAVEGWGGNIQRNWPRRCVYTSRLGEGI